MKATDITPLMEYKGFTIGQSIYTIVMQDQYGVDFTRAFTTYWILNSDNQFAGDGYGTLARAKAQCTKLANREVTKHNYV